jgi:hypothetical protein
MVFVDKHICHNVWLTQQHPDLNFVKDEVMSFGMRCVCYLSLLLSHGVLAYSVIYWSLRREKMQLFSIFRQKKNQESFHVLSGPRPKDAGTPFKSTGALSRGTPPSTNRAQRCLIDLGAKMNIGLSNVSRRRSLTHTCHALLSNSWARLNEAAIPGL